MFYLMVACYAVPARITQGVWKEFEKRLYFAQKDAIVSQRRDEAYEAARNVDQASQDAILKKWRQLNL